MSTFDFSTLITDRTNADLTALKTLLAKPGDTWTAEEREQFNVASSKGAYNYMDRNRVSAAVYALDEILRGYGYTTGVQKIVVPHKASAEDKDPYTWYEGDAPSVSQMERYLGNIAKLRAVLAVFDTTPQTPKSMANLTLAMANNIERILVDLETLVRLMKWSWFYSGEIYSGEV